MINHYKKGWTSRLRYQWCMGIHGYPLEIQVTFLELGSLSEENRDGDFYIFYLDVKHVLISKCSFR